MTEEVEEKKVKRRFHPLSKWQRVTLHGWAENDTAYRCPYCGELAKFDYARCPVCDKRMFGEE